MPIADSLYFVYDGIRSDEMGIINVNLQSGLQEEIYIPEQSIKEFSIRGNDTPYFVETERKPFTIPLNFAFTESFDDERLREVANWLGNQPYYKPLYFSDNIEKWYYTLYTGEMRLLHNCLSEGYVSLQMRNISPYSYSPIYAPDEYDLSSNTTSGTEIQIENLGNLNCKPKIFIEKIGAGEISIINQSDSGNEFKITNLVDKEKVIIDCNKEDIVSDIPLTYHFDHKYGKYPRFVYGMNYLKIYGKCKIRFMYQFTNNF
ncbi:hypothetical protein D3C73_185560 [compost metagenome]